MKFLFLALAALSSAPAFATDWGWHEANLRSKEGADIKVRFRAECVTYSLGQVISAPEVWVEVVSGNVHEDTRSRAVLTSLDRASHQRIEGTDFALQNRGDMKATGAYPYGLRTSLGWQTQRISVVINGAWQTDPLNGTHNFEIDLAAAIAPPAGQARNCI